MPVFSVFNVFLGFGLWQFDYVVANYDVCSVCVCVGGILLEVH